MRSRAGLVEAAFFAALFVTGRGTTPTPMAMPTTVAVAVAATSTPSPATPTTAPTATTQPTTRPSATSTSIVVSTPTTRPQPSPTLPLPTETTAPPTETPIPLTPITVAPNRPALRIITRGDPSTGNLALTFASGEPVVGAMPALVDLLMVKEVTATFFIIGRWAEKQVELLRRIVDENHELANHTYGHPDLMKLPPRQMAEEIDRTERIVQWVVGRSTQPYFRPPFGAYHQVVLAVAAENGFETIYWTHDSTDWRPESTSDSIQRLVLEKAAVGDIIVLHTSVDKTAQAISGIIDSLRKRGLKPGSMSQALGR
ncbi:MAG TPA: polysaccharide deacetylase family protein [Chloroflexota bacterium]|nr:polysaccharide deacetylase family protein [Chloroflexota bacterium]